MNTNPTYSTITVTGGIAVPNVENPYSQSYSVTKDRWGNVDSYTPHPDFVKFEQWKQSHTYATNAPDGCWPKERFGKSIKQYLGEDAKWMDVSYPIEMYNYTQTREFLPFIEQPETNMGNSEFADKKHKETIFYETIGANICLKRKSLKLNQEELAEKLGISRVSMVNIESGKQRLPVHLLSHVCDILKARIGDIVPQRSTTLNHTYAKTEEILATITKEQPEKEGGTVGEAAKKYDKDKYNNTGNQQYFVFGVREKSFIDGAQWQSDHSYSPQEVTKLIEEVLKRAADGALSTLARINIQETPYTDLLKK